MFYELPPIPRPTRVQQGTPDQWDQNAADREHWASIADTMDLTIEGHRLLAQEILLELGLLWRKIGTVWAGLMGSIGRGRKAGITQPQV